MRSEESHIRWIEVLKDLKSSEEDIQKAEYEHQCEKLLYSLGIKREASAFVDLLKNPDRLKEVVFKINNKAFL